MLFPLIHSLSQNHIPLYVKTQLIKEYSQLQKKKKIKDNSKNMIFILNSPSNEANINKSTTTSVANQTLQLD